MPTSGMDTSLWFGGQVAGSTGVAVHIGGLLPPFTFTVTVNEPDTDAPWPSVTVQFTVVVPAGNVEPDAGKQTAGMTPFSTSLPFAMNDTGMPAAVGADTVMFAGGVNVGALLTTVTVNE